MDRNLHINFYLCMFFIISQSKLTETRLIYGQGDFSTTNFKLKNSNQRNFHIEQLPSRTHGNFHIEQLPSRTYGNFHIEQIGVKQPQPTRPRPVVVKCYPDSMEVVVQADLFDTGLQVEGRYLYLGSESVGQRDECGAKPTGEAEFTIWTKLLDCGTSLSVRGSEV